MPGNSRTSANRVRVSGPGVHLLETLAGCKEAAGPLQIPCLSADLTYMQLKRLRSVRKQFDLSNAVPVSGFGVKLIETLAGCKEPVGPLQLLCLSADLVYI